MQKPETQGNQPPPGYPTENPPAKRKFFSASLLCVAVGFVKNAAELQFKIRELYRHINNDCYCFFLRLLAFDFSGFHQAYVVSLLPIPARTSVSLSSKETGTYVWWMNHERVIRA
ncbi:hypothetical protein D0Y65_007013 [Glycine soja]|uniref:Uncharacterized protein n=1 Tax=Glycine soja TaxID=3848 RepID=A0A445LAT9_GLYSO|nr:hypothetical protein D0Y65_007013 [Glycine soja]